MGKALLVMALLSSVKSTQDIIPRHEAKPAQSVQASQKPSSKSAKGETPAMVAQK